MLGFSLGLSAFIASAKNSASSSTGENLRKTNEFFGLTDPSNEKQTCALIKSGVWLAIDTQNIQVLKRVVNVINTSVSKEASVTAAVKLISKALKHKSKVGGM